MAVASPCIVGASYPRVRCVSESRSVRGAVVQASPRFFDTAAAISVFALTIVSCSVVMVVAYLAAYGTSPWGFAEYTRTVALVFGPLALAGFVFKCFVFGAAVAVIPIAAGLDATREPETVPLAVMGGMVRLFVALALIEVAALAVKYV